MKSLKLKLFLIFALLVSANQLFAQFGEYRTTYSFENIYTKKVAKYKLPTPFGIELKSEFAERFFSQYPAMKHSGNFVLLRLDNIKEQDLIFNDSIIIPFKKIQWMYKKDAYYYLKLSVIAVSLSSIAATIVSAGRTNENSDLASYYGAIGFGLLPASVIMIIHLTNYPIIYPENYIVKVTHRDIFRK